MARDSDQYDFFVSYARCDNESGWISKFVDQLLAEHKHFTGGRVLRPFFDKDEIRDGNDWQHRIYHGLAGARLFLAFISPAYFAREWCRREWRTWIDVEIAKHILTEGVRPIYIVEVPGLNDTNGWTEQQVAQHVADLCKLPSPDGQFIESTASVVRQVRRRQLKDVRQFYNSGVEAIRSDDLRRVLADLARDLDGQAEAVRRAAQSVSTVPAYNKKFSGRLEELLDLRRRLADDRAGVICGVHGMGGIGKTELAFTYAHAFAGTYPGGRFLVACEGKSSLRDAIIEQLDLSRDGVTDEERKAPDAHFAGIKRCLSERMDRLGHVLLVLDNVTDITLVSRQQTDALTLLSPKLHLLATTRLLPPTHDNWLTLCELPESDALDLLEKHRLFASDQERQAGQRIVQRLRGFTLAVELVAAWLVAHPEFMYQQVAEGLDLDDLDTMGEDRNVELRRHNHERRLKAVLGPTLASLSPPARRALEYAALLHPDYVALPWLKELTGRDFPEINQPTRLSDLWADIWHALERLALLTPGPSGIRQDNWPPDL